MTATEKSSLLQLPADERAELAELLLRSFDGPEQADIDAAWARESEDRIAAFDRGEINAVDGPAAMAELRREIVK
ncbi:MAG: addiction module protein [Chthoniobacteraceae bacterium]